jgi:citrate lyase subunit beta/citryl-CoA lyase
MRWRSVLFVPGDRRDLAAKAPRSSPDVIVLDLEDAVPAAAKVEARSWVRESAAALLGSTVLVRVNPPTTEWFEGDVASLPNGIAGGRATRAFEGQMVDEVIAHQARSRLAREA